MIALIPGFHSQGIVIFLHFKRQKNGLRLKIFCFICSCAKYLFFVGPFNSGFHILY